MSERVIGGKPAMALSEVEPQPLGLWFPFTHPVVF